MRTLARIPALILTLALCTSAIAQSSGNSTPANPSRVATADAAAATQKEIGEVKTEVKGLAADIAERQLSRLIHEVKTSRELLAAQREELIAAEDRLTAEQQLSASFARSYESAQRELSALREAIDSKNQAIAAKDESIALLTEQRDKERKRASKANKRAALATVGAVALFVLKFVL